MFEAAQKEADRVKKLAEEQLSKARKLHEQAKDTENKWRIAQVSLAWLPISHAVTGPGVAIAKQKTAEASKMEAEATEQLRKN